MLDLNCNSERIPRPDLSGLRPARVGQGLASESKNCKIPYSRSSLQFAAGSFNHIYCVLKNAPSNANSQWLMVVLIFVTVLFASFWLRN
jgi:hypothetical protein